MAAARRYQQSPLLFFMQVLFFFMLPLHLAIAGNDPISSWEVTADRIIHESKPPVIIAEGHVTIKQVDNPDPEAMTLKADWLKYNTEVETISARGNLILTAGADRITAGEGFVDLDDQTGIFHQATIYRASNNLHVSGTIIRKTGPRDYFIEDGQLTTCVRQEGKKLAWSIHSADGQFRKDKYTKLRHVSLRIKDIPVFYLPYLLLPGGTDRKSGLLYPEYTQSDRDGTGLLLPVFLDLGPSRDVTIYPGFLSRRGPLAGTEFRYMTNARSFGTFALNYLHDKTTDTPSDDLKEDGILRTNKHRYWLRGKVNHNFSNEVIGRLDLDIVSDYDYLQEFRQGLIGFQQSNRYFLNMFHRGHQTDTIPFRENTLQITKDWTAVGGGVEFLAVNDNTPANQESTALMALPRLVFAGSMPLAGYPLTFSWHTEFTNYWRDRGLDGERIDLHPSFILPLGDHPMLEGSIAAGLNGTLYHTNRQDDPAWHHNTTRTMYDITGRAATTLMRDFLLPGSDAPQDEPARAVIRHVLRPSLEYIYIPSVNQDDLPQFEAADRIQAENRLRYSLNNYFKFAGRRPEARTLRNLGYVKLYQSYTWRDDTHPFSDLALELNIIPVRPLLVQFKTTLSMYGQGLTHYDIRTRYSDNRGRKLSVDYRYLKHEDIMDPWFFIAEGGESVHELNGSLETGLTRTLSAKINAAHSFTSHRLVEAALHLVYHPSCWSTELVAASTPDDFSVKVIFSLDGLGKALELGVPGL